MIIIITLLAYFAALFAVSRVTGRRATNNTFYRADRRSPWYMVAFGMVGASISGVTYVSVPGMVTTSGMTYLQTCLGFIPGYFIVAFILLPLYYRLNLTTIYSYLESRIGKMAYKTGAWYFLLSKILGASLRFYVVCLIVQAFVCDDFGIPFFATASCMVALIWLYTHRGGIKTLVWTDSFQTICLFTSLMLIIANVASSMDMNMGEAARSVALDPMSRIFVFDDWMSTQNFWKQFVSGAFIVVVMTGLDQDMMQKNLTCKTLREAQKDMCTYGFAFFPANLLFLALGVLLVQLASQKGVPLPANGDELLPMFAATGQLGTAVVVLFTIGIVAAAFSTDGTDHQLLHRHCRARRRRTPQTPGAHCSLHGVHSLYLAFPRNQLYQRAQCDIHSVLLHLRPPARSICLWHANQTADARRSRAIHRHRIASGVPCHRPLGACAYGLPLRLRTPAAQRCPHLCRASVLFWQGLARQQPQPKSLTTTLTTNND